MYEERRIASLVELSVPIKIKKKDLPVPCSQKRILMISFLLIAASCVNDGGVVLTLDFSTRSQWRYRLKADIAGSIASADTQRTFSSAALCTLSGSPDPAKAGILHATVASVSMTSNILSADEMQNLKEQAKGVRVRCTLQDGLIVPEDSSFVPLVRIGEWDLFKDLAKTVPSLPKIKIHVGSSWEREKAIPLETKHGSAVGHLFQYFRLDSIGTDSGKKTHAYVHWRFSYQVELRNADTAGYLDKLPSKGAGTGFAVVNVSDKSLESASVDFLVPSSNEGMFRISWKESISLKLVE